MARPLITVDGRVKPTGNRKTGQTGYGGLRFQRIRGVRKFVTQPLAPRIIPEQLTTEEQFEEDFKVWYAKYGGTRPEYIVWRYLKYAKRMEEGVDFIYQSAKLGGRTRSGGSVVDFELPRLRIFIRVQGEHFHSSDAARGVDILKGAALRGLGYTVVDVWAIPLAQATYTVMEAALRGISLGQI